jgi:hypothetical protein
MPADWLTNQSGVFHTAHASLQLRYSPSNLTIEILSVPAGIGDGPAILIRIPDLENTVGPRYFESMQVDGIIYPSPLAPIPEVISAGWRQRRFNQTSAFK